MTQGSVLEFLVAHEPIQCHSRPSGSPTHSDHQSYSFKIRCKEDSVIFIPNQIRHTALLAFNVGLLYYGCYMGTWQSIRFNRSRILFLLSYTFFKHR